MAAYSITVSWMTQKGIFTYYEIIQLKGLVIDQYSPDIWQILLAWLLRSVSDPICKDWTSLRGRSGALSSGYDTKKHAILIAYEFLFLPWRLAKQQSVVIEETWTAAGEDWRADCFLDLSMKLKACKWRHPAQEPGHISHHRYQRGRINRVVIDISWYIFSNCVAQ